MSDEVGVGPPRAWRGALHVRVAAGGQPGVPRPAVRFVNNNDAVAVLPPAGPYAHLGALKFFDHDGRLLQDAGTLRRVVSSAVGHLTRIHEVVPRWLGGDLKAVGLDQLVDHSPLHYAIRVWNAYARLP